MAADASSDQLGIGNSSCPVVVVEAGAGPARQRWLETYLQKTATSGMRTFSVSGDFDLGGPWAGVNGLFAVLFPEIHAQRPDLVERHVFELVHILPQLRRILTVRNPSLTDLSPPGERSRNYAADRVLRIVHGLIDLLDKWKTGACPEVPWLIACDAYDAGGPMSRCFFRDLMRRRGERLRLRLILGVHCEKGKEVQESFPIDLRPQLFTMDLDNEPAPVMDPSIAARNAKELEEKIGDDALERQTNIPDLIRLWGLACRPDKVLQYKYLGLETCNPLGLYEDALHYAKNILSLAAQHAPDDDFLRWSIIMKMLACYSSLQDAKAGLELGEGEGMKAVENRPDWRAQVLYMVAMLHARYSQPRDLAKGEEYLEQALAAIEQASLPEGERHLHSVFNRNGLAMIRSFQGRHQEAVELCRSGIVRLNTHLAADKHRLHRSVLVYNIAQVYSATGSYAEALEQYATVMAMDPNYSEYYNERGNLFLRMGRLEEAREDYLKAIELSPPYYEVFTNLGQCYRRMGDMVKAIGAYSCALDIEPNQLLAILGRAKAHEELGHIEEAIADYTVATALDPSQWEAVASRGIMYYEKGDLRLSLIDFDRAIELKGSQLDLYQNRATILKDLGRYEEATRDLEMALALQTEDEGRQELQACLEIVKRLSQAPISA